MEMYNRCVYFAGAEANIRALSIRYIYNSLRASID